MLGFVPINASGGMVRHLFHIYGEYLTIVKRGHLTGRAVRASLSCERGVGRTDRKECAEQHEWDEDAPLLSIRYPYCSSLGSFRR